MSRAALLLALPLLFACSQSDAPPADAAVTPDVAGTWVVDVSPEGQDTVLLTYTLHATNETTGWTIHLPEREPMEIRVHHLDADSIVVENGPYPSILEPGETVTTRSTVHVEGGVLTGTGVATYRKASGDTELRVSLSGTRQ